MKSIIPILSILALGLLAGTACNDTFVGPGETGPERAVFGTAHSGDLAGVAGLKLAPGEVQVVYAFDDQPEPPQARKPEGIALDRQGNSYVSDRFVDQSKNQIIRITPDGTTGVLADLGPSYGCSGILGLTTDPQGNVYAAFESCDANHGVWKVTPGGAKERVPGSEQIATPNALTFDAQGSLYIACARHDLRRHSAGRYPAAPRPPGTSRRIPPVLAGRPRRSADGHGHPDGRSFPSGRPFY